MVTDARPRKSEVRAAAYSICARAMLGEEQTVSAAEKSVGMFIAGVLAVGVLTDPATLERLTADPALEPGVLGGLLGGAPS